MLTSLALASALAVDAAVVNAQIGAAAGRRRMLVAALVFGVFQGGMAALGAALGTLAVSSWDHWLAAALLGGVGLNMLRGDDEVESQDFGIVVILGLGVATSLDALAAGASLPALELPLGQAVGLIGAVTVAACVLTGMLGELLRAWAGPWLGRAAGVVLIALGVEVLVRNL